MSSIDSRLRRLEREQDESEMTQDRIAGRLEPHDVSSLDDPSINYFASIAISLKRIADHFQKVDERMDRWRQGNL